MVSFGKINRFMRGMAWLSLLFFTGLMWQIILPYSGGATDIDFLETKQAYVGFRHYLTAFYAHIFISILLLVVGLVQFSRTIWRRYPLWHRRIGQLYMILLLGVSAPAALVLSFYANGGILGKISFIILSVCWWLTAFYAYRAVRCKDIAAHRRWMLRNYALTLSALTLRLLQFYFAFFTDFDLEKTYMYVSAHSWLLNWVCAECWIRWRPWPY